MKTKAKDQQNDPISACSIVKEILTRAPAPDAQFGAAVFHNTYTWEANELARAKTACKLDMVLSPLSTKNNRFFTSREEYPNELRQANQQANEGYFPRFGRVTLK